MTTIYLSGPIDESDEKGARNWREFVHKWFAAHAAETTLLDPLRSKDKSIDKSDYTPNELVLRDTADIEQSDVILVHFCPKKSYQSWGTPGEAALAAYMRKPVVLVTNDDAVADHPWARFQAVRTFRTKHYENALRKACEYIWNMWVKK